MQRECDIASSFWHHVDGSTIILVAIVIVLVAAITILSAQ